LLQDLFLALQNLLLTEFSHFLLLFTLFQLCDMWLQLWVDWLLLCWTVCWRFFSLEVSLLWLNVVLFHEVLFLFICEFCVLLHLKLLVWPVCTSWKLARVRLVRLLRCHLVSVSVSVFLPLLDQLVPGFDLWQMKLWLCLGSCIAFSFLNALNRFFQSLISIWKVPKDSFNAFVCEIESVLDLNFDMNDKALDFFIELIVGPFNQRNDKVDDFSPFLCLNPFMVIKLFFMF
jgi:hypothetical protein